jgi:hypothetical protein
VKLHLAQQTDRILFFLQKNKHPQSIKGKFKSSWIMVVNDIKSTGKFGLRWGGYI